MTQIESMPRIATSKYSALLLILLTVFGLYGHNLDGYWRGDDATILLHALLHPVSGIFFSPSAWQELSAANLTPFLSLSFYADYLLGGLSPRLFYAHHLIVVGLIGFMTFLILSRLINRWLALGGAVLIVVGTPVVTVSSQLMTRHYIEGMLLSLLCIYFYLQSQSKVSWRHFWLAVFFYVLAMTAKEIFVPLGVLLVALIVWERRKNWIEQALILVVVMGAYVGWRSYMLPGLTGGYADGADLISLGYLSQVVNTFLTLPSMVLGNYSLVLVALFLVLLALQAWIDLEVILFVVLIAGLILAPMIPLVAFPGIQGPDRYLLLPWYAFGFALVFIVGRVVAHFHPIIRNRMMLPIAVGVVASTIIAMLLHQHDYRQNVAAFNKTSDAQVRFFWEHDESVALIPDYYIAANFWLIQSSRELKQLVNDGATSPKAVIDDIFLDATLPVFEYSAACSCMNDISATVPARLASWSANNRTAAPMQLSMTNIDGLISWELGPYTTGSYHLVSEEIGSLPLRTRQENLRTNYRSDVTFYLKYIAPEGWISYSPLLQIRPDGVPLIWLRQ